LALIALLAIALRYDKMRKLALSAAVLPLALMVMAVYPYNPNPFYRTWVEYDVMLLLALMYTYLFKEKRAKKYKIKMKQLPQVLPIMIVIGEVLGVVGFSLLRHQYGFTGVSLLLLVPMVIVFALTEEMLFRGLIQRQAAKHINRVFAVLLTVAIYAAATIGMGSTLPLLFGIISATVLGAIYANKQSLVLTTTANIAMKLTYVGLIAVFVLR
jgi:membrane protease YdiL (CAAX protease family)